jgi:hypothetical protein
MKGGRSAPSNPVRREAVNLGIKKYDNKGVNSKIIS